MLRIFLAFDDKGGDNFFGGSGTGNFEPTKNDCMGRIFHTAHAGRL